MGESRDRKGEVAPDSAQRSAPVNEWGEVSERGLSIATGKLKAKLDGMLETRRRNSANRRLARHLEHELLRLFTFLRCPGLDAINNAAERAIRGMVIARKVWGGNRTWEGARTQQILASVLRTCWQQGKDAFYTLREPAACAARRAPGYLCRARADRAILYPHARIPDLLRTQIRSSELNLMRQIAREFSGLGVTEIADYLRIAAVDTAPWRAEIPRVPATAGAAPGRRLPQTS